MRLASARRTTSEPVSTLHTFNTIHTFNMSDLSLRLSVAEKRMQRERYVSRATALSPHAALRRRI